MRPLLLLSALALLPACGPSILIDGLQAEASPDMATVVRVSWSSDQESQGYVQYGLDGILDQATPLETAPSLEHEQLLLGLPENAELSWQVVIPSESDDPEDDTLGDLMTASTGSLNPDLPALAASGSGNTHYIVAPIMGAIFGPAIITPEGEYTWFYEDDRDLEVYRARLSLDGQSLLYNAASVSGDPADDSMIVRVSLDGSSVETYPLPLLAHDFVEHPDGTLGAMVVEYRDLDGEEIRGDQIVEIAPDGSQSVVWSAWDCFDPVADVGDDTEYGWTFANALDFDPDEQAYFIGSRNFSSITRVDRATGSCDWVFGDVAATFSPGSGSSRFLHQHQFFQADGRLLVFDNDGAAGNVSRVIEFEFDPEAGTAEEVWTFDDGIYTFVLGDVTRFDDGSTMVDWATGGQMDWLDASGTPSWKINTDVGYAFGFNTPLQDLYQPE